MTTAKSKQKSKKTNNPFSSPQFNCEDCKFERYRDAGMRAVIEEQVCNCDRCKKRELNALKSMALGYSIVGRHSISDRSVRLADSSSTEKLSIGPRGRTSEPIRLRGAEILRFGNWKRHILGARGRKKINFNPLAESIPPEERIYKVYTADGKRLIDSYTLLLTEEFTTVAGTIDRTYLLNPRKKFDLLRYLKKIIKRKGSA